MNKFVGIGEFVEFGKVCGSVADDHARLLLQKSGLLTGRFQSVSV